LVHDIGIATHGNDNAQHLNALRDSGARALEELRAAGAISAIGLGVNEVDACLQALDWGSFDCFLLAGRYTLLEQEPLKTLMPRLAGAGVSLIVGGVFNSGILATGTRRANRRYYDYRPASDAVLEKVRRLEEVCDAHAVSLPAAAIQFPLAHPVVASIIPGVSTPAEVASAIDNVRARLPASLWSDLKSEGLLDPSAPVPGERSDST
jgi:D-threo-aldose 1-dehydrogenase